MTFVFRNWRRTTGTSRSASRKRSWTPRGGEEGDHRCLLIEGTKGIFRGGGLGLLRGRRGLLEGEDRDYERGGEVEHW
jgi:hypothetical protein